MKIDKELLCSQIPNKLIICDEVDSTNNVAKELCKSGESEGTIIVANTQTGGKGRQGRSFYSSSENGLYFSIILRPKIKPEDCTLITTLASVAVSCAIENTTNKNPSIKWVNDIILNDRKICGILTEAGFESSGDKLDYVILGIGINIAPPNDGFPKELENIAGAIFDGVIPKGFCESLLASIVRAFFKYYYTLDKKEYMSEYTKKSNIIGKDVDVYIGNTVISGIATDIDDNAHLIVKDKNGNLHSFGSGEARVRKSGDKI